MSILTEIQAALRAPKNQHNSFGGYNYRSCEDILEAVKPLLAQFSATLTLSDSIVEVGGRVYVKATATLNVADEAHVVFAFAREPVDRKGMDDSQITGATSSYARKYALNGLFLIDDQKDADATNTHAKPAAQASPAAPAAPPRQTQHPNMPSTPPPPRAPAPAPAPAKPPASAPPMAATPSSQRVQGKVQRANSKEKQGKQGPFKTVGVQIENNWYNAASYQLDADLFGDLLRLVEGDDVTIEYEVDGRGFRNIIGMWQDTATGADAASGEAEEETPF